MKHALQPAIHKKMKKQLWQFAEKNDICPIFHAKSSEEQKKGLSRPQMSNFPLKIK